MLCAYLHRFVQLLSCQSSPDQVQAQIKITTCKHHMISNHAWVEKPWLRGRSLVFALSAKNVQTQSLMHLRPLRKNHVQTCVEIWKFCFWDQVTLLVFGSAHCPLFIGVTADSDPTCLLEIFFYHRVPSPDFWTSMRLIEKDACKFLLIHGQLGIKFEKASIISFFHFFFHASCVERHASNCWTALILISRMKLCLASLVMSVLCCAVLVVLCFVVHDPSPGLEHHHTSKRNKLSGSSA